MAGAVEFSLDAPGAGAVHYVLARPLWGRGLATEAVRAVLGWAFAALPDLGAVRTTVAEDNPTSGRVLEKLGFRRAGAREAHWAKRRAPVTLLCYELGRADAGDLAAGA